MGITATYKSETVVIKDAYIRVERIWGSKSEGWNCWAAVYYKEGDTTPAMPVLHVSAPYVENENPFTALYKSIERLPQLAKEEIVLEIVSPKEESTKVLIEEQPVKKHSIKKKTKAVK